MADTVYQYLYNQVAAAVDDNMTNFLKKVCAYIETPLGIAMTLYVVIYGVMIIRGQVQEPIERFFQKMIQIINNMVCGS
ncbi:MAG: hypothetical protein IPP67_04665 [Rhodospirillaceae bacterium]|nr:hypothetical protein [Rhodospirillaceae bacterium]